jgi:hypothetical protein
VYNGLEGVRERERALGMTYRRPPVASIYRKKRDHAH